jgi:membrane protease YdiL (CAAX protease family)
MNEFAPDAAQSPAPSEPGKAQVIPAEIIEAEVANPYEVYPVGLEAPRTLSRLWYDISGKSTALGAPQPHFLWSLLWMLVPIAAQFVGAVIGIVIAIVVLGVGGVPQQEWQRRLPQMETILLPAVTLTTFIFSLVAAAIVFRRDLMRKLALRGCSAVQWVLVILLVIPLAVVGSEVANWAIELFYALGWEDVATFGQDTFTNISQQAWLIVFLSACVLPGLGEEIFFRGFLSRGLVAQHGVLLGSLIASAFFAALHFAPVQVCATFVLGLGMQYLYLTTRSLLAPILLHILNNSLAFIFMRNADAVEIEGFTTTVEDPSLVAHVPLPAFLAAAALVAAIGWVLYRGRTKWILADGSEWKPGYFAIEGPKAPLEAHAATSWPSVVSILALVVSLIAFVATFALTAM